MAWAALCGSCIVRAACSMARRIRGPDGRAPRSGQIRDYGQRFVYCRRRNARPYGGVSPPRSRAYRTQGRDVACVGGRKREPGRLGFGRCPPAPGPGSRSSHPWRQLGPRHITRRAQLGRTSDRSLMPTPRDIGSTLERPRSREDGGNPAPARRHTTGTPTQLSAATASRPTSPTELCGTNCEEARDAYCLPTVIPRQAIAICMAVSVIGVAGVATGGHFGANGEAVVADGDKISPARGAPLVDCARAEPSRLRSRVPRSALGFIVQKPTSPRAALCRRCPPF
jgi:hypothetical protein